MMHVRTRFARPAAALLAALLWTAGGAFAQESPATEEKQADAPATSASDAEKAEEPSAAPATPEPEPVIQPKLQLHVPSVRALGEKASRSPAGVLAATAFNVLAEAGRDATDSVDVGEVEALLSRIRAWPDTSITMAAHAPDVEGRPRVAVRFDWPLKDLHSRLAPLLESEIAGKLLKGMSVTPHVGGGYRIRLPEQSLGYLVSAGESGSAFISHPDVEIPSSAFAVASTNGEASPAAMITCRLNFTGTEKDSGATFFSSFSVVTAATYTGHVGEDGAWQESFQLEWPAISGIGAKAIFEKAKQTFFVPEEAFGAGVVGAAMLPAMFEGALGLETGTISARTGAEVCVTLLPGTGFLPIPDAVVQLKAIRAEKLLEDVRKAVEKVNAAERAADRPEIWREIQVRGRPVFSREGGGPVGVMLPFTFRPAIFLTKETDARGRSRDFLAIAWTSGTPGGIVSRWLDFRRDGEQRHLPRETDLHGQAWIHWKKVAEWLVPWINLSVNTIVPTSVLPRTRELSDSLPDATVDLRMTYTSLQVSHRGPLPAGALAVPALIGQSIAADRSTSGDLAREREARERLRVLYHHAKLFRKDFGRWPAEVGELNGYIDFDGHPYLLRLQLSSRKSLTQQIERLFGASKAKGSEKKDEDDEDRDAVSKRADEVYVIDWGAKRWTLGVKPGLLDHLETLCIDQDGEFTRVEKKAENKTEKRKESAEAAAPAEPSKIESGTQGE